MFWSSCSSSALVELDVDVADALLNARRAPHSAWPPPSHVRIRTLVHGGGRDEERVRVDVRLAELRVGDRARDQLLDDGGSALRSEIQELECFGGVATPDEVHDHSRLARTNPLKSCCCLADHRAVSPCETRRPSRRDCLFIRT